jgi:hypothetical protein
MFAGGALLQVAGGAITLAAMGALVLLISLAFGTAAKSLKASPETNYRKPTQVPADS